MVEVGIRELKSRLSYYVQLAQAGETIAVKVRNKIVSFLSGMKPPTQNQHAQRNPRVAEKLIAKWKTSGLIQSGGLPYHHRPFKAVKMSPGPSTTDIIRQMRDEEA